MVLHVDSRRLRADFDALATFGATPEGGVDRPTFSEAHSAARAWFLERAGEAGLETAVDGAANHSVALRSRTPGARTLLLGSHLDSVPRGGRYDGALGVICALEVLRVVKDEGLDLPVTLEVVDFTDEEGTLIGTLGSLALAGRLVSDDLAAPRGGRERLLAEIDRMGLAVDDLLTVGRDPETLAGYLELHIEQGPVLEQAGVQIGVVTGISGASSLLIVFEGAARHAGTTPMDARRDAALGAAAFAVGVNEIVVRDFPGCVATVGDISVEPGAFNVVPGRASVRLDCRSLAAVQLDALERALVARAHAEANRFGLLADATAVGRSEPSLTDESVRTAIAAAAGALGLTTLELASGAGHDAQSFAGTTPSGMVFVPSDGGVSHDPAEHTAWADCSNGADVLLNTTVELATASRE